MSTYTLPISDTRLIFNCDYGTLSFYSIAQGKIIKGERLLSGTQKYVKLEISGTNLSIENGISAPVSDTYDSYEEYGQNQGLSDVWNDPAHVIVGTGDLRPNGIDIDPDRFSLTDGVVITSPSTNTIGIYQLI